MVLGALAFRAPKTRKAVGILWDLGSFWPRDVHPLAPPCYAERTVPELAMRLAEHAAMVSNTEGPRDADLVADTPGFVVLASHSQGTVISMAALLGPGRNSADRTVLLTFGTVLRRLYAQVLPVVLLQRGVCRGGAAARASRSTAGGRRLGTAGSRLVGGTVEHVRRLGTGRTAPAWSRRVCAGGTSGGARTTWVAGWAIRSRTQAPAPDAPEGLVQIDVEFVDPLFLPGRGDSTMPAAGRHSNFPRDPAFQAQLMQLVRASFASLDPAR